MKIAVTGVAGFIGCNLAERLIARGDEVRGLDDFSHGTRDNIAGLAGQARFQIHEGSILDPQALAKIAAGADALIHLAAGKIPRYGDALDTLVTNGEGGLQVLRACRDHGVRRMVLASTSDCYGRNPQVPFTEESASVIGGPHVRRWSYAISKMFEEQAAFAFRERHQLETVILRLFGGYGPRQNLTWWGGPQSVFIGAALRGEELEVHGTGQQTRSFTYVSDMVEGFVRAVDVPAADGEMLNIGADREITIEDLARLVWRMIRDDEPRIKKIPLATFGRYEDVERRVPDNGRATRILGYTPQVQLEEGLPHTIAWQREAMARAGGL
ncbi:MAG TPA: NAD-dependent epimerase/dehydratase family protein [Vicinamibacteria bacterium]|nr:NAD-dependent epimerase/dehydratase family protein [Vicinamibacteria bacterium]